MQAKQFSLFVTICIWAMLIGGIMYSHIVYMPAYLGHLPESNNLIRGEYGLKDENFWMFIHPFAILSTIAALVLNWKQKERRKLISITATIYGLVIIATAVYFVPGLQAFAKANESGLTPASLYEQGQLWQRLSWVRGACMFSGFILLLVSLTKRAENLVLKNKPYPARQNKTLQTMEL